jgi:hypothetical protein
MRVQLLALKHCWTISTGSCLDHPPYSSDLALSNYRLFTYLTNWLRSQHSKNNQFTEGVKTWLSSQAEMSDTGIQKHIPRYDKWLNSGSDYVEK